jgi:hypothetical protein
VRLQLFPHGGARALGDFSVNRRLLSEGGLPLAFAAGFDALQALHLTPLHGSLAQISQSLPLVGRTLALVSQLFAAIGDATPLVYQTLAPPLGACFARPDTLQPGQLSLVCLLFPDTPLGSTLVTRLFALGRGALALVDGPLALIGQLFALIGDPLALVGKTGTLLREALKSLERRFALPFTDGLHPQAERLCAGQPLALGNHLLALGRDALALGRDALALCRDALTLRRQLGQR